MTDAPHPEFTLGMFVAVLDEHLQFVRLSVVRQVHRGLAFTIEGSHLVFDAHGRSIHPDVAVSVVPTTPEHYAEVNLRVQRRKLLLELASVADDMSADQCRQLSDLLQTFRRAT